METGTTTTNTDAGCTSALDALAWTQTVCADRIRQILLAPYLDIMTVSRAVNIMKDFRLDLNLPAHPGKESIEYRGLDMLHCARFDKLAEDIRRGIPTALMHVLGLTDHDAPILLGAEGWSSLKAEVQAWCKKAPLGNS